MSEVKFETTENSIEFNVKVVPGSSKTAIAGVLDDSLKIKIAAAPEKGKANKALIEYLSKELGVKKNDISIITGEHSPVKRIRIACINTDAIIDLLGLRESEK